MALSLTRVTDKGIAINTAFAAIGAAGKTAMPRARANSEPAAWELYVAQHLSRLADARKKRAMEHAAKVGVIPNVEKNPLPPGTHALVYAGDVVEITCGVNAPRRILDVDAFVEALAAKGVNRVLLETLRAEHTYATRAPHTFAANLVADAT